MEQITGVEFVQEAAAQDSTDAVALSIDQFLEESTADQSTETGRTEDVQTAETGENTGAADQQPQAQVYKTQAEVDTAIGYRIQAERNKFMRDNKDLLDKGNMLAQYTQGMTADEVSEALQQIAAARLAKDSEIDEKTARAIVRRTSAAQPQPAQQEQPKPDNTDYQRQRINAASDYMNMIGDPGFTLETLRTNRQALADFAGGMSVRDVYMKHFRSQQRPATPVEKRGASVAGSGNANGRYSNAELDRMLEYVRNGGKIRFDN